MEHTLKIVTQNVHATVFTVEYAESPDGAEITLSESDMQKILEAQKIVNEKFPGGSITVNIGDLEWFGEDDLTSTYGADMVIMGEEVYYSDMEKHSDNKFETTFIKIDQLKAVFETSKVLGETECEWEILTLPEASRVKWCGNQKTECMVDILKFTSARRKVAENVAINENMPGVVVEAWGQSEIHFANDGWVKVTQVFFCEDTENPDSDTFKATLHVDFEGDNVYPSAVFLLDDKGNMLYERPKIMATFTPQAWIDDYAIDCDPGPVDFEITNEIFDMGISPEALLSDKYCEDALRFAIKAPDWIKEWNGPFIVVLQEGINEIFGEREKEKSRISMKM